MGFSVRGRKTGRGSDRIGEFMILYAIVLGIIVVTLLSVSLARLGSVKTKADYLVAGRSLPAFVLVFTLLSSWIGSGSLLGGAENAYKHGFYALWQGGGGWAGLALIYFIAPRARKFAQFTIPDLLETRYNQTARVLGVIAVLFTYTAITSYQFIGGGDIVHLIFPQVTAVEGQYILAGFVILFTAIAGMGSVAYMDVVIGLLATVTMIAALPVLINLAGGNQGLAAGWRSVHAILPATHFSVFSDMKPINALELFLPTCLLMLGNQSMYQKFFSAKSEKDATRATVGWIIGTVILETVIVAIAVVGSALYPTGEVHDRPREILAYTAVHGFGGDGLCEGGVDGEQLSIFACDQSGERHLCALLETRGWQQANTAGEPIDGGGVGMLGAMAIAGDDECAEEESLRVHNLFRSADAGNSGSILLAAGNGEGGGREHRGGDGGHGGMGFTDASPARGTCGTRCDFASAGGFSALSIYREPGNEGADRTPPAAV
jgi:hypothetical protein